MTERISCWDTSSLGKLYFLEADSPVFARKAAGAAAIVTAKLALHEMRRVAFRKESNGLIPANTTEVVLAQVNRDIATGELQTVELDTRIEGEFNTIMARRYRQTPPIPIRTFDASRGNWPPVPPPASATSPMVPTPS